MNYKENPIATTLACIALGLTLGFMFAWAL